MYIQEKWCARGTFAGRIVLCLSILLPLTGWGQQGLKIELNKLESVEGACRAYVVFVNHSSEAYDSLKLDLVMFDAEGVINKRLAVEGAPLPLNKTSVKLFDIRDVSCEQLGRILLNDVLSCQGPAGKRDDCLSEIETTTRTTVTFFK